jgi:MbtH protein
MSEEDHEFCAVVVNHEEQYSIWPQGRAIPSGWKTAGKEGTKDECLAFIREIWSDMRPLSLRKRLDASEK